MTATWLSSRNDAISTTAFAMVGFAARVSPSQMPEILLDIVLIALTFQAAGAIFLSVRRDWQRRDVRRCSAIDKLRNKIAPSSHELQQTEMHRCFRAS